MEALHIPFDGIVAPEAGGGKPFADGTKRLVRILPTRKDGTSVEAQPYAKDVSNPNNKIPALNIRVEVVEGQRGAKHNLFKVVPLARQTHKRDGGMSPAYDFFGFMRAMGVDVDAPGGIDLSPEWFASLGGRTFEAIIGLELDNKGEERNFIRFFNEGSEIYTGPDPEYKPLVRGGAQQGGGTGFPTSGFTPGAQQTAPLASGGFNSGAQQATPQFGAAASGQAPAWMTQPPAPTQDPAAAAATAAAQAAAQQGGY